MSGGIAYVYDKDKDFKKKCNMEMVELYPIENKEDEKELKSLIEKHFFYTKSGAAEAILGNWEEEVENFIKVFPLDYKRVLEEMKNELKPVKKKVNGEEKVVVNENQSAERG